ncbi:MAG: hypothetical protein J6X91_09660 [Bacteroidales bacterium]|nr:hypothetical protein [Bacteroidales bacterium]
MKKIYLALMCAAAVTFTACGGNSGNSGEGAEAEGRQTEEIEKKTEAVAEEAAPEPEQIAEEKVEPKKWHEKDFVLKEKMYVGNQSITRTYARKGNVVIGTSEGSPTTSLFVCTDSTRSEYMVGNSTGKYGFIKEKPGFTSVDDAIYKYLKSQMSETVFGKTLKKDDPECVVKDTVVFGKPAYIITKEHTEKNIAAEAYGKTIMWIDKETGMPYYKYGYVKSGDQVIKDGPVFEVVEFSDNPDYEGLIVSLDGLEEIKK